MPRAAVTLALFAMLAAWHGPRGYAQQMGRTAPRPQARGTVDVRAVRLGAPPGERDPLRPYGADDREPTVGGGPGRWSPTRPPEVAPPRRTAPTFNAAGPYFSGMRAGQGANRNVIDPRSLCVPGRMALIQRGR